MLLQPQSVNGDQQTGQKEGLKSSCLCLRKLTVAVIPWGLHGKNSGPRRKQRKKARETVEERLHPRRLEQCSWTGGKLDASEVCRDELQWFIGTTKRYSCISQRWEMVPL